ncbi:MAG: inorganic phosphate transporter [Candidatus Hydrogenedentes bacterium]|nr:inorganic phosphate transporter [Candidatus Hydrogenedentota bacterium]
MQTLALVVFAIIVAVIFDLINGFHDSANSIATVVSTRVLSPRVAVLWAAFFNFAAMFLFAPRVADTIAKIVIIDAKDHAYVYVVLAGLLGAIVWDLLTWWWGLPTSSSHALIGGLIGAGVAHGGWRVIRWEKLWLTFAYIPLAPVMGMAFGFGAMVAVYWIFRRWRPMAVDKFFRRGQILSAAMYSLGHGGNDAQKTMGIIVALLVAGGYFQPNVQLSLTDWHTVWIILICQAAMGLGTAFGGWRIVKTMGMKITKLKPVGGFCAEMAGASTLFAATHLGIPVSTTHVITGAIVGVGSTTKFSTIKWGVARSIIWAWVMTIPLSALVAAACFYLVKLAHPAF